MGHHKARRCSSLARVSKNKPSGDRLLIVTEDSKSVPTYFGDIRRSRRIEDIHALPSQGDLLKKLRVHLPDYEKSAKGLFCKTKDHLDDAKKRTQCLGERGGCDFKSPLTKVDKVVAALQA